MGVASRDPDRRHGGCIDHLRALLSRVNRHALSRLDRRDSRARCPHSHTLAPRKNLPGGLGLGFRGEWVFYPVEKGLSRRALAPKGRAATTPPATAVMRLALG